MMLDVKERVFAIVDGSDGLLDFEAVAHAFAQSVEKMLKVALDELANDDDRIIKNRGGGYNNHNTFAKKPLPRR